MKKPLLCNHNISNELNAHSVEQMVRRVESSLRSVLDNLLIDWEKDHNMKDTPKRVAKMLVYESFSGRYVKPPRMTDFPNVTNMDQLITVGPADVKSTCAHHLQPIYGKAWIGVLPKKQGSRLIGLSKFIRTVDYFARRPQIQEEMTVQITDFLEEILKPAGIIVFVKARHFCMCARGVNQDAQTTTIVARGKLRKDSSLKEEFFHSIKLEV